MSPPRLFSAPDIARDRARDDLDAKPERWLAGPPFKTLDIRPGRVLLFGAPPGAGKTTFALQLVSDLLDHYPLLRCVVGNVETAAPVLLDKLLARFASVPLDAVMNREFLDDERRRIDVALTDRADLLAVGEALPRCLAPRMGDGWDVAGRVRPPRQHLRSRPHRRADGRSRVPPPHREGEPPSPCPPCTTQGKRKPSPVVRKLFGWNRLLDGLRDREPRLHPLAVAIWCWLWKCEKDGRARTSERKLAERFGVCRDNIRARLDELTDAGFLAVARRGVHGRSATVYRVRPTPKKPTSTADVDG